MLKPYYETSLGKLYHGECLDILPEISADVLLTDPVWPNNSVEEFADINPENLFHALFVYLKPVKRVCVQLGCDSDPRILWSIKNMPFIRVFWLRYSLPGHKGRILYSGDVAYLFGEVPPIGKNRRRLLCGESTSTTNFGKEVNWFPCPRKLSHVKFLVSECSHEEETILDPFMGSGTTAISCESLDRKWIGIERSEQYCEQSAKRIDEFLKQGIKIKEKDNLKRLL